MGRTDCRPDRGIGLTANAGLSVRVVALARLQAAFASAWRPALAFRVRPGPRALHVIGAYESSHECFDVGPRAAQDESERGLPRPHVGDPMSFDFGSHGERALGCWAAFDGHC